MRGGGSCPSRTAGTGLDLCAGAVRGSGLSWAPTLHSDGVTDFDSLVRARMPAHFIAELHEIGCDCLNMLCACVALVLFGSTGTYAEQTRFRAVMDEGKK